MRFGERLAIMVSSISTVQVLLYHPFVSRSERCEISIFCLKASRRQSLPGQSARVDEKASQLSTETRTPASYPPRPQRVHRRCGCPSPVRSLACCYVRPQRGGYPTSRSPAHRPTRPQQPRQRCVYPFPRECTDSRSTRQCRSVGWWFSCT